MWVSQKPASSSSVRGPLHFLALHCADCGYISLLVYLQILQKFAIDFAVNSNTYKGSDYLKYIGTAINE